MLDAPDGVPPTTFLAEEAPEPLAVAPLAAAAEAIAVVAAEPAPVVVPVRAQPAEPIRVEPFVLPQGELAAIAESAGLQWVNSDVEKIRAVQEAMAREPKPVHVPRERKPAVVVDEGPLVLVETRKDLAQIKLPFENQPPA